MKHPQTISLGFNPPDSVVFELDDAAPAVILQWSTVGESRAALELNADVASIVAEALVTAAWGACQGGVVVRRAGRLQRPRGFSGGIWAERISIELDRAADTAATLERIRDAIRPLLAPTTTITDGARHGVAADYFENRRTSK